ncbi:MAG: Dam family site-specific DNA-(adenine-N6)-methyltransferase [Elusimicrobia bacterium]|nr:Dam family site-specific DNA-(adenine-N6)-methyltransferase [Elusimicrobiota bacterium]
MRQAAIETPEARPILKWAGGKQWLAAAAPRLIPTKWQGRYYEPFLGGGAIFFAVNPKRATLADYNTELVDAYKALRESPQKIVAQLRAYPHNKKFYYSLRGKSPRAPAMKAARLLYLNRTCWNGLYRVNRKGAFNTPFGRYKNPTICDSSRLQEASKRLRRATLLSRDFEKTVARVKRGDFVYFDPPYITGHTNNGFLKYNAKLFSWSDQERLARVAIRLNRRGAYVLISNANHPDVIDLYKGFSLYSVTRNSLLGSDKKSRGSIAEILLSNYALMGCKSEVIK